VKVERGASWTKTYVDGFGRPRETVNSAGVRTVVEYDADGRKVFESVPFVGTAIGDVFEYDALGRLKRVRHHDESHVDFAYIDNTVEMLDELGQKTVQTWEAFGSPEGRRLAGVKDAHNKVWSYTYSPLGSLRTVSQPDGATRP